MIDKIAFFDELTKIGAITDEQARGSLDRLDTLERTKPTMSQVGRYAGLGAVAGPVVGAVGNALRGGRAPGTSMIGHLAGAGGGGVARAVAGSAATGAIGSGLIPLVRNQLDRHAEIGTLKKFVQQQPELPPAAPGPAGTEVMGKIAFSPMSELKLLGNGVRRAATGARNFLAQPMGELPSNLGSPAQTKSVPLVGGGMGNITIPAKPPNVSKLLAPGQKEQGLMPRGAELLSGKRLHNLREGAQFWEGKAQKELARSPDMINGMFDPTVSAEQLQRQAQGAQGAQSSAARMQAHAAGFQGQMNQEANAVAGSRLLGAAVGGGGLYAAHSLAQPTKRSKRDK